METRRDQTLSRTGRAGRVVAVLAMMTLLVMSALWGEDDHFPFAPFKMYAGAADPDAPTIDTRVEARDADGRELVITERNSGLRRAEIEGQLGRFEQRPELLAGIAEAYHDHNPRAAELTEVRIVVRWHEVREFEVTGDYRDDVVATWQP